MEMPLGTNSHLARLGNRVYGGCLNMKGDIFSQKTRLILFDNSGSKISVHRVTFLLVRIINLQ
jgi:hypothetical protein